MATVTDILMHINSTQNRQTNIEELLKLISGIIKKDVKIVIHSDGDPGLDQLKNNITERLRDNVNVSDNEYCPKIRLFTFSGKRYLSDIPKVEQSIFIYLNSKNSAYGDFDRFCFPLCDKTYQKVIYHPAKSIGSAYDYNITYVDSDPIEKEIIKWIESLPPKNKKIKVRLIENYKTDSRSDNISNSIRERLKDMVDFIDCDNCPLIRVLSSENCRNINELKLDKIEQSVFICPSSSDSQALEEYKFPDKQNEIKGVSIYSKIVKIRENNLSHVNVLDITSWLNNIKSFYDENNKQKVEIIEYVGDDKYEEQIKKSFGDIVEFVKNCSECRKIILYNELNVNKMRKDIMDKLIKAGPIDPLFIYISKQDIPSGTHTFIINNYEKSMEIMWSNPDSNALSITNKNEIKLWLGIKKTIRIECSNSSRYKDNEFEMAKKNLEGRLREYAIVDNNCNNCPKIILIDDDKAEKLKDYPDSYKDLKSEQSIFIYLSSYSKQMHQLTIYELPNVNQKSLSRTIYHRIKTVGIFSDWIDPYQENDPLEVGILNWLESF